MGFVSNITGATAAKEAANNAANASRDAMLMSKELGQAQLDESKRQFEINTAANAPVLEAQLATLKQTQQQGKEYYDYFTNTFKPIETGLAADATNFSTKAYAEGQASKAAADVGVASENQRQQTARALAATGINPNSGKALSLQKDADFRTAAVRAGAMTSAREKADALGWAKRMDVTSLGRNLASNSVNSYNTSTSAGNSFVGNQAAPGQAYMQGMVQSGNTQMAGQGQYVNTLTGIMQSTADQYGATMGAIGSIAGAATGASMMPTPTPAPAPAK